MLFMSTARPTNVNLYLKEADLSRRAMGGSLLYSGLTFTIHGLV